ncbi:restriction endonuclease subunit S [Vibrio sp. 10N.261.46.A3]|uniref:restriction endonuclease subunit S n=1 Tax=Vibrio sp. 10N.261.46.A3 TaxID=3229658 RepID=UPI0035523FB5
MSVEQTSMNQLITDNIDIWTSTVKTKSASGRGSSKKCELYGVKKLRELILELAVRGKLVPQDPMDEPASVLLERIAEEKAQLVKDKKISKTKKLPSLTEAEKSIDLPSGWALCRFGDLYHLEYGDNLPKAKRSGSGEYPVYGSNGVVGTHNNFSVDEACVVIGRKGSAGALNMSATPCWVTDVAYSVIPPTGIELNYCFLHLNTFGLDFLGKGIKPGLNRNEANVLIACIPPTEEQHRIVAKVDELMTLCDQLEQQTEVSITAHQVLVTTLLDTLTNSADADELMQNWARISEHFDTLFTTEASIDQLKQTILQLAVMGKLVPQDPNDEPAAKLLERIAEEKAQLIKDKKAKDSGKMHPKAPHGFQVVIPSSWEWCRFRDVAWCFRGHNPPKAKFIETPKEGYVRFVQITDFKTELSAVYVPESSKNKMVYKGEIIMAAYRHIGKLSRTMEGAFNVALCKVNDYPSMSRDYLELLIGTGFVKGELLNASERGHIPSMHSDHLLSLLIPLPPLAEQERILVKYNQLIDLCNMLRKGLTQNQSVQIDLTNTIIEQVV